MNKTNNYSEPVDSPEERVSVFISHWHEQWSTAQQNMGEKVDFKYWSELILEVDNTHFVTGSSSGSRGSFSSCADHDLNNEKIIDLDLQEESAQVFTQIHREGTRVRKYYAYDLKKDVEKGWLISGIFTLFHPPKNPLIDINKRAEILAMSNTDAPFIDREGHIDLNENTLFQTDRTIKVPHLDEGVAKLEKIGNLQISSGVIGILDFGYDIYNFEPLQKRVKPGNFPVETVTIHNCVAGIRVKFTDAKPPVKWYAANTLSGNGVYGVDAGNLAIFDVNSLMGLNRIGKEKIYTEWGMSGKPELVSMTGKDDCVLSSSGYGDGAYPAFWGVDEQDEVVSLYIDFMILVQENENGIYQSI